MTPPEQVTVDPADTEQVEQLRRSVAMLQPGAWALKRETALVLLGHLVTELRTSRTTPRA